MIQTTKEILSDSGSNTDKIPRSLMISNFILFQIGWFACVLSAANHLPLAGSLIAAAIIMLHIYRANRPLAEMRLILTALLIGCVFESLFTLTNLNQYTAGILVDGYAPHWMVMMWGLFAATLNVSMRWMKTLPMPVVGLLAAVLAPLSYLAGNRLGAVTFPDTTLTLLWIAAGWAVLFPLLVFIAKKNDGYTCPDLLVNTPYTDNNKRSYTNV